MRSLTILLLPLVLFANQKDLSQIEPGEKRVALVPLEMIGLHPADFPEGDLEQLLNLKQNTRQPFSSQLGTRVQISRDWVYLGRFEASYARPIRFAPTDGNIVYAGTYGDGVYKSSDGGSNWFHVGPSDVFITWKGLKVAPSDSNTVWISSYNVPLSAWGVFKTTDGGNSWMQIVDLMEYGTAAGFGIHPTNLDTVYVGMYGGELYRTTDGGNSWTEAAFLDQNIYDIEFDPSNTNEIWVATYYTIYHSSDGGNTWIEVYNTESYGNREIEFDPIDPSTIYIVSNNGISKSTDSGISWTAINNGLIGDGSYGMIDIQISGVNPDHLWASSYQTGAYRSTDGGVTWTHVDEGPGEESVYSVAASPSVVNRALAGTGWLGVYGTTDGTTWERSDAGLTHEYTSDGTTAGSTLLTIQYGAGIQATDDGGATWTDLNSGLPDPRPRTLVVDPTNTDVLYVGTGSDGVYKSTDGGTSWVSANGGVLDSTGINNIAIDQNNPSTLFAATWNGLYKTINGGESWTNTAENWIYYDAWAVAVNPYNSENIVVGAYNSEYYYDEIFYSTDGGTTWNSAYGYDNSWIQNLIFDPNTPNRIYLASWGGGVWRSDDGGANWISVNDGLPGEEGGIVIADVAVSPLGSVLAGTWGAGAYLSLNGSTWEPFYSEDASQNILTVDNTPTGGFLVGTYRGWYTFDFSGDPEISVTPSDSLNFGQVFIDFPETLSVGVHNIGVDPLHVTDISVTGDGFTAETDTFTLYFGQSHSIDVIFNPLAVQSYTGTLSISSNDTANSTVDVVLIGGGVSPPDISISPDSLYSALYTGGAETQTLTITNSGGSDLNFTLEIDISGKLSAQVTGFNPNPPSNDDKVKDLNLLNPFKFSSTTSHLASGPGTGRSFKEDIKWSFPDKVTQNSRSSVIQALVLSNWSTANNWIVLNFSENMPEIEFSSFNIYSTVPDLEYLQEFDVVLLFEDGTFYNSTAVGDRIYEFVMAGGNLVLGTFYWQDRSDGGYGGTWGDLELIDPVYGGSCDYEYGSLGTLIDHPLTLEITSLLTYYRGGPNILRDNATAVAWWADGDIFMAYNKPGGTITAITTYPAEPVYQPVEGDFYQVWENALMWTGGGGESWLVAEPTSGTISAGSSLDLSVTFNAEGLIGGDYFADLFISNNDPDTPEVTVPIHLNVTGAPDITVEIDTLDFGQTFLGFADTLELTVTNSGTDILTISSVVAEPMEYSVSPDTSILLPGDGVVFSVRFDPAVVGEYPGSLTFTSDDPDEGTYVVTLLGQGVEPPVISVSPDSLNDSLFTGEMSTQLLTITNSGGSDLIWEIELENIGLGEVTFTKEDYADWTLPENQDRITDNVWITRKNTQGIFNAATESGYSYGSPDDTEWAFGYTEDLGPEDYQIWVEAVDWYPPGMVNQPMSLHLISDDKYFDILFHSWTSGGNGGGFSYTRTNVEPSWLEVSELSGIVPADSSAEIEVTFDAAGLFGGDYEANILISNNDPVDPLLTVPVSLNVTGAPDIWIDPDTLDYGETFVNYGDIMELVIGNDGTDVLEISGISTDNTAFFVDLSSLTIGYDSTAIVMVTFLPTVVGDYSGTLTIVSNDQDEGVLEIPLSGSAVEPPIISVTPDSFIADLFTNDSTQQILTVANTGVTDLIYQLSITAVDKNTSVSGLSIKPHKQKEDIVIVKKRNKQISKPSSGEKGIQSSLNIRQVLGLESLTHSSKGKGKKITHKSLSPPELNLEDNFPSFLSRGWTLLYTDPDEPYITYDLGNVYGNTDGGNIAFKFESYVAWEDTIGLGLGVNVIIDADQDTTTGYYVPEWEVGIDFAVVGISWWDLGLYSIDDYGNVFWISPLTVYEIELNSNVIIIGVSGTDLGDPHAIDFYGWGGAVNWEDSDAVPDEYSGHISWELAPPWITLSIEEGIVPAGNQEDIMVTFDATNLFGGDYYANILVTSNDPANSELSIPAHLRVTGIPIYSGPDSVDFGLSYVGYENITPFIIENIGTDVLEVSDITSDDAHLSVSPTTLSIPPLSSDTLTLILLAESEGAFSATVTMNTNDTTTPSVTVSVFSTVLIAPDVMVLPDSIVFDIASDAWEPVWDTLFVGNQGGSDLDYIVSVTYGDRGRDKGGPDAFGYTWKDSNEPDGPVFNWIDASDGTSLYLSDDDYYTGVPLGFSFSYYGVEYSTINIMSNGWMSFTDYDDWYPEQVPDPYGYYTGVIAPFGGDLYPPDGVVRYKTIGTTPNRVFIVEFNAVPWCCSGPPYMTFEVLFYESGDRIRFQYLDLQGNSPEAIGISSPDNSTGLGDGGEDITFISSYIVEDNYAIEFLAQLEWLSVDPFSGIVPPDEMVSITVTAGEDVFLEDGVYIANLLVSSNDPDQEIVAVPVTLYVSGLGVENQINLPTTFALHQNYPNPFNPVTTIQYDLPEVSDVRLVIYDLLGREVITLIQGRQEVGYQSVRWNGRDRFGREVATGVYIYQLIAGDFVSTKKLVLIK